MIVAEGAGRAEEIASTITTITKLETRFVVLGHIQRGGVPTGRDRIVATRLGAAAIDCVLKGKFGKAVGIWADEIHIIDLKNATQREFRHIDQYQRLIRLLT